MRAASAVAMLELLAAGCGGAAVLAPTTTVPPSTPALPAATTSPTTTSASTTTTTVAPSAPMTTVARGEATTMQLVDPATLAPSAPPVEVPGNVATHHSVALPDGKLMVLSWGSASRRIGRLSLYDPATGAAETIDSPFSSGVRVLGYSPALGKVVLLDEVGETDPQLFDPVTMRITDAGIAIPKTRWIEGAQLFDRGRKLAMYSPRGFAEPGIPPVVQVADLVAGTLSEPLELDDVIHGLVEVAPEHRRDPESPYGTAYPGLAWDVEAGRLYVAHADSGGLTVVDLYDQTTLFSRLGSRPSQWAAALSWLIPPAEAKGNDPTAWLQAFLSADRSRLFVTGVASDAWRDPQTNELHTTTRPLGVTVVDTSSLEAVATLELPVSVGLASRDAVVLAGTTSDDTFCDEVCDPDGPLTERSDWTHSGLYVLDSQTLDIRAHFRPGANFYPQGVHRHWLITESFGEDGLYVDSLDLTSGALAGRADFGTTLYMVTDVGVFKVDLPAS